MISPLTNNAFLASYAAVWVVLICLIVMTVASLRHLGLMYEALNPVVRFSTAASILKLGESLPRIQLTDLEGGPASLNSPVDGKFRLLVLVQPSCEPCHSILARLGSNAVTVNDGWVPTVVVVGTIDAARRLRSEHDLFATPFFLDARLESPSVWGITGTPYALVLDSNGRVQRKVPSPQPDELLQILQAAPASQVGPRLFSPDLLFAGAGAKGSNHNEHTEV
ncbi:MAG: hypothetical protein KGJ86_10485 [Chloroflexota bacterium]|nr:hypothetical protein [Chloroflexota bacterium]